MTKCATESSSNNPCSLIDEAAGMRQASTPLEICEICNLSPVDHGQSSRNNVEGETRPVTRSVSTNAKRRERREEKKKEPEPPRRAHKTMGLPATRLNLVGLRPGQTHLQCARDQVFSLSEEFAEEHSDEYTAPCKEDPRHMLEVLLEHVVLLDNTTSAHKGRAL